MIKIASALVVCLFSFLIANAQIASEEIPLYNEEIRLPGTLSYLNENTPLIIWVHGSGPVDRNGNQPAQNVHANYIKQFRDAVNAKDIAFFSYDKRTASKENIPFLKDTKAIDFALDVQVVLQHFKDRKRFSKIILVGHSQGSLIAMLAAKDADKYISIAGAGATIDQVIVKQIRSKNSTLGDAAKQQFDTLKLKGKIAVVNPFLMSLFAKRMQPFLYSWLLLNPTEELKKLTLPILIINGTKDLQVQITDAQALHAANSTSKLVLIKNMNHVLKDIHKEEDNLKSYYSDAYPISQKLIETVVSFVKK